MTKIKRQITVVYPEDAKNRFAGRVFRNYKAVAMELNPGEQVTVTVRESTGKVSILAGYGEVERIDETSWSEPRGLSQEY